MPVARLLRGSLLAALAAAAAWAPAEEPLFPALPADQTPRAQLERALTALAHRQLRAREETIAAIRTRDGLEARRRWVRETVLRLMGGLPSERTPLRPRVTGRHEGPGFSVENVVFESQPGLPVTANLYRPAGASGRLPALLASMGHYEAGKAAERLGPDLARKGFVVLAYDPIGQGERLQHYDPDLRVSRAGGATEEHGQAAARAELIGQSVARDFVWDAMRGLDYLASRPEVDADRLGAVGCSGGGTVTLYLAALDERLKAAAVACYVTSWSALVDGPGPQEAEQSLPGFLAAGLDMGDYVAAVAPRPLLVASTRDDFFPLEGARAVVEEGRRWYGLLGAGERIEWSVSDGPHGISPAGRVAIAGFFQRWLAKGAGDPSDPPDARLDPEDLQATETGQVSTALHARTVADLIAERAAALPAHPLPASAAESAGHRARLREALRTSGIDARPAPPPELALHGSRPRAGYRLDVVSFPVEPGASRWGLLAVPEGPGPHPAVLLADPRLRAGVEEEGGDLDALARRGQVVLAVELGGAPTRADPPSRPSLLGPLVALYRRASVAGTSLVALRARDVVRAVDLLAARGDVDPARIDAVGRGGFALPVLHAAVLDPRIARVGLVEAPASYREFLDHPIHRDLPEILVPGVLRAYDLGDLLLALAPRPVTLVDPTDAVGQPLARAERARYLGDVLEADRRLGGGRIRVLHHRRGDPFRWE